MQTTQTGDAINRPGTVEFKALCRRWRKYRKLSQLELSLSAEVSQRHLSWLETGRSQPSRDMVLRICNAMEIPLRERNRLYRAAGYAEVYTESRLDEPDMAPVLEALDMLLEHHDPFPAIVIDRMWSVRMTNLSAARLLELVIGKGVDVNELLVGDELNLALMTLHPKGLRVAISNWNEVASQFIRRLTTEAAASGDQQVMERLQQYIVNAGPIDELATDNDAPMSKLLPVMPLCLDLDDIQLSLFSVISTFGTPQDITTDELRIETFYPSDDQTRAFFQNAK